MMGKRGEEAGHQKQEAKENADAEREVTEDALHDELIERDTCMAARSADNALFIRLLQMELMEADKDQTQQGSRMSELEKFDQETAVAMATQINRDSELRVDLAKARSHEKSTGIELKARRRRFATVVKHVALPLPLLPLRHHRRRYFPSRTVALAARCSRLALMDVPFLLSLALAITVATELSCNPQGRACGRDRTAGCSSALHPAAPDVRDEQHHQRGRRRGGARSDEPTRRRRGKLTVDSGNISQWHPHAKATSSPPSIACALVSHSCPNPCHP